MGRMHTPFLSIEKNIMAPGGERQGRGTDWKDSGPSWINFLPVVLVIYSLWICLLLVAASHGTTIAAA